MQQLAVGKQYMNFSWWHIVSALIQISASWTLRNMWQIYEMIHEIDMVAYHFRVEYDGQTCVWWWLVVNECVVKDGGSVVEDGCMVGDRCVIRDNEVIGSGGWGDWWWWMRWLVVVDEVMGSGGWGDWQWWMKWWWWMKCGVRWSVMGNEVWCKVVVGVCDG